MPRIIPAQAPHDPALQATLDHLTPPGVQPLVLFRTLARSPRLFQKFLAASLLDRGELSLREREIVILRTCALNGCEYEWGVHVTLFGPKAAFTPDQVTATVDGSDAGWSAGESALLAACDALHHTTRFDPPTWHALREHCSDTQVLEVISLAGFYRTVCLHANALELPPEPFAARFPQPVPAH